MGVDAKWGRLNGACPKLSRNVTFCPRLSLFVLLGAGTGTNWDKRGQTGTKRDISGQIGKRPHLASAPFKLSLKFRRCTRSGFRFVL